MTAEHAERFKQFYQDKELAPATTCRRLKMAKMLFGHAVKLKLISENPFTGVRTKNTNPAWLDTAKARGSARARTVGTRRQG